MPRLRFTVDGVIGKNMSVEDIESLTSDIKAHVAHSVFPSYENEINKFDVNELNLTVHQHVSTPYESCQFCYRELSGDEKQ